MPSNDKTAQTHPGYIGVHLSFRSWLCNSANTDYFPSCPPLKHVFKNKNSLSHPASLFFSPTLCIFLSSMQNFDHLRFAVMMSGQSRLLFEIPSLTLVPQISTPIGRTPRGITPAAESQLRREREALPVILLSAIHLPFPALSLSFSHSLSSLTFFYPSQRTAHRKPRLGFNSG